MWLKVNALRELHTVRYGGGIAPAVLCGADTDAVRVVLAAYMVTPDDARQRAGLIAVAERFTKVGGNDA